MRIFFDIQDRRFLGVNGCNAISKPRSDTQRTLERLGWKSVIAGGDFSLEGQFPKNIKERIIKKLNRLQFNRSLRMALGCITMNSDTEVFVQYPFLSDRMYNVLNEMKLRECHITILFHDFYTIRERRKDDVKELSLLKLADVVIAHSQPMAQVFKHHGCMAEVRVLGCFDYLLDKDYYKPGTSGIVFAGNLEKSPFISKLQETGLDVHLYGKGRETFPAERPDNVKGKWGLVWDGESTEGCTGLMGDYLRYNSPFKFSLYLSIGKPVIVWSQSALAHFVSEQHLGIVVDSINEMPSRISALTEEQLNEIQESVGRVGQDLRSGRHLERVLTSNL